ncbi:MAG: BACON domain-containing carbohydrate-binding protein [Prolixibacteraceae bacterium]|jgi:hypothetical protein|nr:BACON domain-containing carbohydrate-binding protein [Prolixibacteraceae bacterium]
MKTKISFLSVLFLLLLSSINAQVVAPNVRVNDVSNVNADLVGGRSMDVLNDSVYIVWSDTRNSEIPNIFFSKSIDGGQSFLPGVNIIPEGTHLWPSIAVDPDGVIYVAWNNVSGTEEAPIFTIWFTKSVDGGQTFQTPIPLTNGNSEVFPFIGTHNDNVYVFYTEGINFECADYFLTRSTNKGANFETPVQVNDAPCSGTINFDICNSMAIDDAGSIYLAWVDGRRAEGNGDIYFSKSSDNGLNFSPNVMVNNINSDGADADQYLPAIAVGGTNSVYVGFVDLRLGADDWTNNRVYLSVSENGGTSFSPEVLLAGYDGFCKGFGLSASPDDKLSIAMFGVHGIDWGLWLQESTDGGKNYTDPTKISDEVSISGGGVNIIRASNGYLNFSWTDDRTGDEEQEIYFSKTLTEPELTVSPNTFNIAAPANSNQTFNIASNVEWTVSSDQTWLTPTPTAGSNNATITLTAAENVFTIPRTATLTVAGIGVESQVVTITQAGLGPALFVSDEALTISSPDNSVATFTITSNIDWSAESDQNWLTPNPATGNSDGTVTLTADENTNINPRIATVTVSGVDVTSQIITVTQLGATPVLLVSVNVLEMSAENNSTSSFSITSNTEWTVSSDQTWLTAQPASGSNNATVTLTASENTINTPRTGNITISATETASVEVTVTQAAGETTGLNETETGKIELFPNPTDLWLNIKNISDEAWIAVYDMQGRICIEERLGTKQINVSELKNGFYFVKVIDKNNTTYLKMIKH